MTSIRKKLLIYILSAIAFVTLCVAISTYFSIRHEMDELYDENMKQLAGILSGTIEGTDELHAKSLAFQKPHGEEEFLIQIWHNDAIEYSSHPVVNFPLMVETGFGHHSYDQADWTYYSLHEKGRVIQIAQELKERHKVVREIYNALLIPILTQFPVVALLVFLLIGYGFRPLERISGMIQSRTADFMRPIPLGETPDEIRTLVLALNDLLGRLDYSLQAQRQFTADAAHELRTPLTAVRLQLDLLQRSKNPDERQEALETLERGVSRSIHLVHQLLELARQEPDYESEQADSVNLGQLIMEIVQEQKPMAEAKSINLQVQSADIYTKGNTSALSIMIGNLVNNAITYTNMGGHIQLRTYLNDKTPTLEISDDGIGIKPEDRMRIFDRFYRVTGTGTSGSGLGLSIVKTIAQKHGIQISISEGIGGKGTTFRLTFLNP